MGTTLEVIAGFMDAKGFKYDMDREKNRLITGFKMNNYRAPSGRPNIGLLVELEEDGEYLVVSAPHAYEYKEGPHLSAVLQACLWVCYATKGLQYEYDYRDGEIRAVVEIPLEDAILTERQFHRILGIFPAVMDRYDSLIRNAMESGTLPLAEDSSELATLLGQIPPSLLAAALDKVRRLHGEESDEGEPPSAL
jgi:hypothetical protein